MVVVVIGSNVSISSLLLLSIGRLKVVTNVDEVVVFGKRWLAKAQRPPDSTW